jgi:adenosylmethionine-8-amino-7-oxononanoate aminotransferase
VSVRAEDSSVFLRLLDWPYPDVERGEGVRLFTTDGREILDACSGGAMVTALGHHVPELVAAAAEQADRISYMYNHHFTNEPQERLADKLIDVVAPGMARVRLVSGGSEANETALRLARSYHVERGDPDRWRVITQAQAYHGSTMGTLALSGRSSVQGPFTPYLAPHLHVPPADDPTGAAALDALDRALDEAGPDTVAAYFCEPVSAAALPGYSPPDAFWEGLAERRERHGFLVCFDEVVTGIGRVGTWLAADQVPIQPDIVSIGKGLGAGHAPLGAVLCTQQVYDALDQGSRQFDLGHTWDGAPLSCAVGAAVIDLLVERDLVSRVRDRGPSLRDELAAALDGCSMVREVRGRGFLLGVEYADPRDPAAPLPETVDAAEVVDRTCLDRGVLVLSTHATPDGFTGDHTVLAPAFTATDQELAEMVERFAAAVRDAEGEIGRALAGGA